jgi:Tol biopolymer transport system component
MSLSLAVLFWLSLSVALEYQRYATETSTHALLETHSARGLPAMGKKGVMLMNRIGPSSSKLYIANANGTNERLLLNESVFEYHASWSSDGKYITYTSERNGDGNSDIYRVKVDGSGMEMILGTPSFEDCVAINPDGTLAAYVSTANGFKANIWVMDLTSKASWNLTNTTITAGNASLPGGHFRPSWSHVCYTLGDLRHGS